MDIIRNFPAISILICLFAGIISSGLKGVVSRHVNSFLMIVVLILNLATFGYTYITGESFVYVMGIYPAPWGNELRAGVLEALMASFFTVIMLLCMWGGIKKIYDEVDESKFFLYYVLIDLLLSSLLALVYTNDMFTAYVFIEINTISACGLIMIRQNGRTIMAAVRYMVMSLLGSGLFLLGLCILYDITGHILMSDMHEAILGIVSASGYNEPLLVSVTLMCVGLAIKSALFPFHAWLPDAYGYSTVSSAAILSSLVSKGYIFLLFKIIYRVIGADVFAGTGIEDVFFVFGLLGMIFGSVSAIRENDIRRMTAFSSVAQIGYIYMGIGMRTEPGMVAAVFHMLSHGATKSLLFIAAIGLTDVSGGSRQFKEITGAGYRNKWAGAGFLVGSLSMVGVPLFSGFISKLLFAQAAANLTGRMLPALIVLGISTILNAIYFMKTVIRIYTPVEEKYYKVGFRDARLYSVVLVCLVVVNIILGINSDLFVNLIRMGLNMFS